MSTRAVGVVIACLAALPSVATAGTGEPDPARRQALLHLLRQDCGSCHGMTLKGGLGLPLLPDTLAGKDEAALADVIRNGVPGTPMPPWAFSISPDEALWLARILKEGLHAD
ncbi:MAG: cytochrome c [Alphaproteobacteria bacterium]|nr:cytochrome c [Alphaproteobacteria bacterium]MBF0130197.1 cytochrome c [Alphaproteobacteria bacterium]